MAKRMTSLPSSQLISQGGWLSVALCLPTGLSSHLYRGLLLFQTLSSEGAPSGDPSCSHPLGGFVYAPSHTLQWTKVGSSRRGRCLLSRLPCASTEPWRPSITRELRLRAALSHSRPFVVEAAGRPVAREPARHRLLCLLPAALRPSCGSWHHLASLAR